MERTSVNPQSPLSDSANKSDFSLPFLPTFFLKKSFLPSIENPLKAYIN